MQRDGRDNLQNDKYEYCHELVQNEMKKVPLTTSQWLLSNDTIELFLPIGITIHTS